MASQPSVCPDCGKQGRWGFDDDWCHEDTDPALDCPREGLTPDECDGPPSYRGPRTLLTFSVVVDYYPEDKDEARTPAEIQQELTDAIRDAGFNWGEGWSVDYEPGMDRQV
jgi:hypothetical protein